MGEMTCGTVDFWMFLRTQPDVTKKAQVSKTHVEDWPFKGSMIVGEKNWSLSINCSFHKPGLLLDLGQPGRLKEIIAMKLLKLQNTKRSYLHA